MSRLFLSNAEINFINSISKELIQRIVGQEVIYYSVSEEHTKTNDLYDEAIKKTVFTPVRINALIMYENPVQTNNNFTIDTQYRIECYFHKWELAERHVDIKEGDFIQFGTIVYEIETVTEPQIVFGQIENKVMSKVSCRVARQQQFSLVSDK